MNKIGTKEHWIDYSNVRISRDDEYGNAERTSEFELQRQLSKIGKPVDKTDWQMSQPTVNAYYDPQENDINFPQASCSLRSTTTKWTTLSITVPSGL